MDEDRPEDIVLQTFEKDGITYDLVIPGEVAEQARTGADNVAYSPVIRARLTGSDEPSPEPEPVPE